MIGAFPDPYPDELLYSVCARYKERLVYLRDSDVFRDFFGVTYKTFCVDKPNCLQHLVSVLPPGHHYSIERFIQENTLVPFYQAFSSKDYRQSCKKWMSASDRLRTGWITEDIPTPNFLRFCPLCAKEEEKILGEAYWHRLHQIGGVEVCPIHRVFLQSTNIRLHPKYRIYQFETAPKLVNIDHVKHLDSSQPEHIILLKIVEDISWILNQEELWIESDCLRNFYITILAKKGYVNEGRLDKRRLCKDYLQRCRIDILNSLQFKKFNYDAYTYSEIDKRVIIEEHIPILFDDLILQPFRNAPLRHLLMIQFLGYSAEGFFQGITEFQEIYKPEYAFPEKQICFYCKQIWRPGSQLNGLKFNYEDGFYEGRLSCLNCDRERYTELLPTSIGPKITVLKFFPVIQGFVT